MPWASSVKSILEMWYPGQQGGPATAERARSARSNPGGKLPVTFPADATHFPTYDPNCTDTSATGNCPLYPGVVGPSPFLPGATTSYRTLTAHGRSTASTRATAGTTSTNVTPLFPFGYGLSYTRFSYSDLHVRPAGGGGLDVSFRHPQRRRLRRLGRAAGLRRPVECAAGRHPAGGPQARAVPADHAAARPGAGRHPARDARRRCRPGPPISSSGCSAPATARSTSGRRLGTSRCTRRSTSPAS